MNNHEQDIFNGRCPYNDKPCPEKISCLRCQMNEREKELMEKMDEIERFEMLQEELAGYENDT